jgi:radical SAM protein with 4Fe4S-binding SPASM domain
MACDYCFEEKNTTSFKDVELFVRKMKEVLDSDFFKKNYELLNINFWGGEPTLETSKIRDIFVEFKYNPKVTFFIFSNGYDLQDIKPLLSTAKDMVVKGNHPKITIQISYDGPMIHYMHRKDKQGNDTSDRVISSISWLDVNKVPYVIKPVIRPEDFRYLPVAYEYIKKLTYEGDPQFFKSQNYHPTIEYYNVVEDPKVVEENLRDLRKALIEIAGLEIVSIKERGHKPFFSWFHKSMALCSAGAHFFAIDINGDIYPCHGMLYNDNKRDFRITNIKDDNFIQKLQDSSKVFSDILTVLPNECMSCETTFCMKCNAVKFSKSKKTKYMDRWRDYTNQPVLCQYYKEIGKVSKVFQRLMRRK